jgi:outer membrane protein OmpA-like peptidoglycan-associated protein/tetratricopeptide (TPR) repeat protein
MKKIIIPIILFISFSINAIAQEKSRQEINGDKFAFKYSFDKAIESYNQAKQLTPEGQRHLSDAYHQLNQDVESEIAYAKLLSLKEGILLEDYFNYSKILKANGKYEEAFMCMDKFAELKPNDLRVKDYKAHKAELPELLKDDGKYKLVNISLNTDDDDFGTSYFKNNIVFASTRATAKMIKRTSNWNGKPYLNMYISEVSESQLKDPEIFDKGLDGKLHDGPASFNKEGTYIAFTRNNYDDKSKDKVVELQIYFSSYLDGKWSEPIPFAFNNETYSAGHPCLTADGKTMYFTCDMPGGFGGADIYRTTKNAKGEWAQPENLGDKLNTEGDETFPFFEETNGRLLFVSDGRFGLGGTDIFISNINGSSFDNPINAGAPLNTRYDDFSIIADGTNNKGYFSSNRTDGKGGDDIYSVDFLKWTNNDKKLKGIAKDVNGNRIPNTFITLLDEKGKTIDTLSTKNDAAYTFTVNTNKQFKLIGKNEGYTNGESEANTMGKELVVVSDVILLKKEIERIEDKIKEGADLGKIVEFKAIYFDLDKYKIRSDAEPELKKIIKIMNEYPNMKIELGAHTDCRETKAYNQILSNKRAKASVDYIRKGITDPNRITGKGYGKTKLINSCSCDEKVKSSCSEEEHQKNRRTEFIITKK